MADKFQTIPFEGKDYTFPADATREEILAFFNEKFGGQAKTKTGTDYNPGLRAGDQTNAGGGMSAPAFGGTMAVAGTQGPLAALRYSAPDVFKNAIMAVLGEAVPAGAAKVLGPTLKTSGPYLAGAAKAAPGEIGNFLSEINLIKPTKSIPDLFKMIKNIADAAKDNATGPVQEGFQLNPNIARLIKFGGSAGPSQPPLPASASKIVGKTLPDETQSAVEELQQLFKKNPNVAAKMKYGGPAKPTSSWPGRPEIVGQSLPEEAAPEFRQFKVNPKIANKMEYGGPSKPTSNWKGSPSRVGQDTSDLENLKATAQKKIGRNAKGQFQVIEDDDD